MSYPTSNSDSSGPAPASSYSSIGKSFFVIDGPESTTSGIDMTKSEASGDFDYKITARPDPDSITVSQSMTESRLQIMFQKINELNKENNDLKDFLKGQNSETVRCMKAIMDYKQKQETIRRNDAEALRQMKADYEVLRQRLENTGDSSYNEQWITLQQKFRNLDGDHKATKLQLDDAESLIVRLRNQVKETSVEDPVRHNELEQQLRIKTDDLEQSNIIIDNLQRDSVNLRSTVEQLMHDLETNQNVKNIMEGDYRKLSEDNLKLRKDLQDMLQQYKLLKHSYDMESEKSGQYEKKLQENGLFSNLTVVPNKEDKGGAMSPLENCDDDVIQSFTGLMKLETLHLVEHEAASVDVITQTDEIREEPNDHSLLEMREKVTEYEMMIGKQRCNIEMMEQEISELRERFRQKDLEIVSTLNQQVDEVQRQMDQPGNDQDNLYSMDVMEGMRNRIMCLMNENQDLNLKMNATIDELKSKTTEWNNKTNQYNLQMDSMKMAVENNEKVLAKERIANQTSSNCYRKQLEELRGSSHQLMNDYRELLEKQDQNQQAVTAGPLNSHHQEEVDQLKAQIMAAEESLCYKNDRIKKMEGEIDFIPALRAQAEGFRSDFEQERQCRERLNEEKERVKSEMSNLHIQNQQLIDEMEHMNRGQITEMQRRHADLQNQHIVYQQPPPQQPAPNFGRGYSYPDNNGMDDMIGGGQQTQANLAYPQQQMYIRQAQASQHDEQQERSFLRCPKCNNGFPDMMVLQEHFNTCLI